MCAVIFLGLHSGDGWTLWIRVWVSGVSVAAVATWTDAETTSHLGIQDTLPWRTLSTQRQENHICGCRPGTCNYNLSLSLGVFPSLYTSLFLSLSLSAMIKAIHWEWKLSLHVPICYRFQHYFILHRNNSAPFFTLDLVIWHWLVKTNHFTFISFLVDLMPSMQSICLYWLSTLHDYRLYELIWKNFLKFHWTELLTAILLSVTTVRTWRGSGNSWWLSLTN